ncbi:uncharacterized protein KD926_002962 [Aspergillus affinis]|uniref:uncharacterized protein n=1 Tax=Aspergillus affinis TaxID=1070780 RepID=UPI0022FDB81F|nr:uncharacterized protein KD926_002962 [Aspergillus affinis]KAI9035711.1 hypothetical protein KD926_002962 [Aspergillus affinis]
MIPKVCYLLFAFFLSLVVASPVALEQRTPAPSLGLKKQTIQSGTRQPWTAFGSYLTFDKNAKIEKEHLAGLAKAAYEEMYNIEPNKRDLPNVMTAIKVDNEVFLSSNMKGGGGVYIYNMQEQPLANKPNKDEDVVENGYGAFTDVLQQNAPDVKDALDALRKKSRELDHKNPQSNSQQPSRTSNNGGKANQNDGKSSSRTDPGKTSQELKSNRQTTFQHKNDANCGEVMASLRYRMVHKTETLKNKKPQPTIVAWSVQNGVGKIRAPCEQGHTLDDDDACGLSWGCGAFTGPQGMNFNVVPAKTKAIDVADKAFPQFKSAQADLPSPTIKKTTRPPQNNNGQPGPATKPKNPKQPAQPPKQPAQPPKDTKKDPKKDTKKGGRKGGK